MDNETLIQVSRARFDHTAAKQTLREKYQSKLIFAYNGGMWRAGPELLVLLQSVPVEDPIVIEDLYGNPVQINPQELQFAVLQRWQEQMNAWLVDYENISKQR